MTVAAPGFAFAGMTRILLALLVTALRPAVVDLRVLAVLPPAPPLPPPPPNKWAPCHWNSLLSVPVCCWQNNFSFSQCFLAVNKTSCWYKVLGG